MSEYFDDLSTAPVPEPVPPVPTAPKPAPKPAASGAKRIPAPERATTPAYAHRVMRVKSDRTLRLGGRRYRPNEIVECEIPEANKDDVAPSSS